MENSKKLTVNDMFATLVFMQDFAVRFNTSVENVRFDVQDKDNIVFVLDQKPSDIREMSSDDFSIFCREHGAASHIMFFNANGTITFSVLFSNVV